MKIKLKLWVKILIFIIITISLFLTYSRYIGTNGLIVKEHNIIDSNIPNNFYGIKIVHISDIHYKVTTTYDELKHIIDKINLSKPDIVILSGDLFNSNITYLENDYNDVSELLNSINYTIGKYAIKGDNDLKISNWDSVIKNSNFIDLNDNYEFIYYEDLDPILITGISSNYKKNHIKNTINNIYEQINTEYNYSILVLHEPDFIDKIDYNKFNLILSGHSLGGYIKLPFIGNILKEQYSTKYQEEYYKLNNTNLYISSGIGTNKYKFRFLNKPSFNLYRLRNK